MTICRCSPAASAAGCDAGHPLAFVDCDSFEVLGPHAATASVAAPPSTQVSSDRFIWQYYALLCLRGSRLRLFKVNRSGEERLAEDQCADACITKSAHAIKVGDAASNAELD